MEEIFNSIDKAKKFIENKFNEKLNHIGFQVSTSWIDYSERDEKIHVYVSRTFDGFIQYEDKGFDNVLDAKKCLNMINKKIMENILEKYCEEIE